MYGLLTACKGPPAVRPGSMKGRVGKTQPFDVLDASTKCVAVPRVLQAETGTA